METRVAKLEDDRVRLFESLARIEGRFDVINARFDTVDARFDDIQCQLNDKPNKLWTAWVSTAIFMAV